MHELTVGGVSYKLARLDEQVVRAQLAWARSQLGDPLAECARNIKDFPPELHKALLDDALAEKKRLAALSDDAPEIQARLQSVEGLSRAVLLLYQRHNPSLSEDQIWQLHAAVKAEHGDDYLKRLMPEEKPKG